MQVAERETIRVAGQDGLLSVIPPLVGFHPTDSLVMVGVTDAGRVGPVARVDMSYYRDSPEGARDLVAALARHVGAVAIVTYGDDTVPMGPLMTACEQGGLTVLDVIRTNNAPAPIDAQFAAAMVVRGDVISGTRDEMRAMIEPNADLASMRGEHATVFTLMQSIKGRDAYLAQVMHRADETLPAMLAACQAFPDPTASDDPLYVVGMANLVTVTALLAYRCGKGALAQVALDRVLRINPYHRLAHLTLGIIAAAINPAELDALVSAS